MKTVVTNDLLVRYQFLVILLLFFPLSAESNADTQSYLPLHVGNQWSYEVGGFKVTYETANGERFRFSLPDFILRNEATGEAVPDSLRSTLMFVKTTREFVPDHEVVLSVLSSEEIGGMSYYRMNTGQLLRLDVNHDLYEYNEQLGQDTLLFAFSKALPSPGNRVHFGYLKPFDYGLLGWPWATIVTNPVQTAVGVLDSAVAFSSGDGIFYCSITFGWKVGVVDCVCGSDVAEEGGRFKLTSASIQSDTVETNISGQTWGWVKHQDFSPWRLIIESSPLPSGQGR